VLVSFAVFFVDVVFVLSFSRFASRVFPRWPDLLTPYAACSVPFLDATTFAFLSGVPRRETTYSFMWWYGFPYIYDSSLGAWRLHYGVSVRFDRRTLEYVPFLVFALVGVAKFVAKLEQHSRS
jgi:hypothetical protein